MIIRFVTPWLCAAVLGMNICAVRADEVTLRHKGLTLNADLVLAENKHIADGVILITHGALAHRGMEAIVYLQALFRERGHNTLAINLSLGRDNRHGMYDCKVTHRHRQADAADEIAAWVVWLKGRGVRRIAVLGHSRGGAQTALYAATHDEPLVRAAVLMAPATRENNDAADYQRRHRQSLAPVLHRAQQLVREGRGGTVMEHVNLLYCRDTSVTAEAFVSYYAEDPRLDTPTLLPMISKPVLVLVAGDDEVVVGLDRKVTPLVDGKRLQMKVITAADHFFRDLHSDDAVDAIDVFLTSTGY